MRKISWEKLSEEDTKLLTEIYQKAKELDSMSYRIRNLTYKSAVMGATSVLLGLTNTDLVRRDTLYTREKLDTVAHYIDELRKQGFLT